MASDCVSGCADDGACAGAFAVVEGGGAEEARGFSSRRRRPKTIPAARDMAERAKGDRRKEVMFRRCLEISRVAVEGKCKGVTVDWIARGGGHGAERRRSLRFAILDKSV